MANRHESKPEENPANVESKTPVVGGDNEVPKCDIHVENGRIVATCESTEEWDKLAAIIDEEPIIGRIQGKAVLEEGSR